MRVVAFRDAEQAGDVDDDAPVDLIGLKQMLHPVVVTGAVHDHDIGVGDGAGDGCRRLVVVRVGAGRDDYAFDRDAVAADSGRGLAVEVFGRDDGDGVRRGGERRQGSGQGRGGKQVLHSERPPRNETL